MHKSKNTVVDDQRVAETIAQLEEVAREANRRAHELANTAGEWASPHVQAARSWLEPRLDRAWRRSVQIAAPKVSQAVSAVAPVADAVHEAIVGKVVPTVMETMSHAVEAAEPKPVVVPKKRKAGKVFLWLGVSGVAAGIGYLVWRQTRPLDDPWAEDAWAAEKDGWELDELIDEGASAPRDFGEAVTDSAEKIVERAKDVADDIADAAGDAAEAVGQAAGATVKKVSDVAKKAQRRTTRKAKDIADDVADATD